MLAWRALALLFILLLLPGCFDYEVDFTLTSDGSGQVCFSLYLPPMAEISWQEPLVARIDEPAAARRQIREEGRLVLQEEASFLLLGKLSAHKIKWDMALLSTGFLGLTTYTYKLTTTIINHENIIASRATPPGLEPQAQPSPNLPQNESGLAALALRARAAGRHAITITQHVPGPVEQADTILLGAYQAEPKIEGNQVSWRLPLAQLIGQDVRYNLAFSCIFKGDYQPGLRNREAWASRLTGYSSAIADDQAPANEENDEEVPEKNEDPL
jgi:hypothetical protein